MHSVGVVVVACSVVVVLGLTCSDNVVVIARGVTVVVVAVI